MAKHILLALFFAFALGVGAVAWSARAAEPAPAQPAADDSSDGSCSNPAPAALIADIRVSGGG